MDLWAVTSADGEGFEDIFGASIALCVCAELG